MFDSPDKAEQYLNDNMSAGSTVNQTVGTRTFINRCMYEGIQWLGGGLEVTQVGQTGRRPTNWNPDSNKLVATINRITKLIHETSAATFPDRIELECPQGDRDTGIESSMHARVMESAANAMVDFTGYTEAARTANFRRCIDGTHGLGWDIMLRSREIALRNGGTEKVEDQVLRAFTFDSMQLTLDPLNQKLDLADHEYVIHSKVWPVEKIRRGLGIELRPDDLQTCGELMGMELYANAFSMNRLYANMALFSRTKGARVHQMHVKDEHGRFSTMLIGVRVPGKAIQWVNFDNQESPFGGCGMPLMLLHGYRRPDSMWSVSDVAMLKDDQDRLNLLNTFFYRMLQKNAGAQWLVAEEALKGQDPDEFKSQFNNAVYGLITHKMGTKDRPIPPPELVPYPAPQPFVQESIQQNTADMREQVHRPDITAGGYKTHTTNQTYQSALQGANQVLGNRTREDLTRHEWLNFVGLGTVVKLAQEGSPSILGALQRAGFDEQDFAVIAQADAYYPVSELRMRESSIKYESKEQKEDRLWKAVQLQVETDPMSVRMTLAEMETPMSQNDKTFYVAAQKTTQQILAGMEWQPFQLGEYESMFLAQFRRGMFDRRAANDPATRARLDRAITVQMQFGLAQKQAQAMAENPQPAQPPPGQAQEQPPEQEGPSEADLSQILGAIQKGSTAQPVAA